MKITRHTARDMRQALRAVREQLGPDAVILSSRRTGEGVEVTAAMDFDAEQLASGATPATPLPAPSVPAPSARVPSLDPTPASQAMGEELKPLRRMLEPQLAQLAWNDLARRAPVHTEMLRELTEIGIAHDLAAEVMTHIPGGLELTQARRLAIAFLAQCVLVTGDRWLENGGRIAFVGPTGVGKTATLAKLAVRWVLRYGARDLALVAGDRAPAAAPRRERPAPGVDR